MAERGAGFVRMNRLAAILPASNVLVDVDASSKKRVFEQAGLLFENQHAIARGIVSDNLFARERLGSTGLGRDIPNALRILADLPEPTASAAFTRTLRAVVDWRGQVVTMLDRCYLTESVPVQLIWGEQDVVIPVSHAHMAHAAMPGSRLEVFPRSGHFPFHDDPHRFIDIVEEFIDSTTPADYDQDALRELLRKGSTEHAVSESDEAMGARILVLGALENNERSAT